MTTEDMRGADTSQVKALVDVGLLSEHRDTEHVICDECADRCYVKVHRVFDPEGRLAQAYCQCEDRDDIIGRIEIPLERLVEWRTSMLNIARFLSMQLGITTPPVGLSPDRIWRLGPIRYAGQRTDVFLAIAPTASDFSTLWENALPAVDQCSSPVMLVPGEAEVAQFVGHKAKVLSLTRLLYMDNGHLRLDIDEIGRAASSFSTQSGSTSNDADVSSLEPVGHNNWSEAAKSGVKCEIPESVLRHEDEFHSIWLHGRRIRTLSNMQADMVRVLYEAAINGESEIRFAALSSRMKEPPGRFDNVFRANDDRREVIRTVRRGIFQLNI